MAHRLYVEKYPYTLIHFVSEMFYNKRMNRVGRDRLVFNRKGQQTRFIRDVKARLGLTWPELGELVDANDRSLRDWAREKHEMGYKSALLLSKKSNIPIPKTAKVKKWLDHLKKVGRKGAINRFKKYGRVALDEEYRQEKWLEWWNKTGKYLPSPIDSTPIPVHLPKFSKKLAEFVGIMLGDGGISKYQLVITLNRVTDRRYSYFVKKLIRELFHVEAARVELKDALADNLVISRVKIVEFAMKDLGLVLGNKVRQQVDIPDWVKKNKKFAIACVRGLVDTDGSVFTHNYKVGGKWYAYKKLSYTSMSAPLLRSFYDILTSLGITCRFAKEKDVRIDSRRDMEKYFKIIGSSNPKHLKRYLQ